MPGLIPRFSICCLALLLAYAVEAQVPFTCDGRFYMTQVFSAMDTRLVEVDINPLTEEVEFNTIDPSLGTVINGIGYRSEENLIYGVHPVEHLLYRIDATGNVEELTRLGLVLNHFYLGADITPDGRYLVLIGSSDIDGIPVDLELAYVDLEDPDYGVEIVRLKGDLVNMLDMAYDPTNNDLYAFDSGGNRLVRILPDGTVTTPFPPSNLLENAGSVFFDVFGDLYAYGSPSGGIQTTLYAIDKETGAFRVLTTGAQASATDACSCPFSVEVRKTVSPEVTIPCSRVEYSFAISNLSSRTQSGITFEDVLPPGFVISSIIENPFGGVVQSGPGTQTLQITDISIPPGVDTLVIAVDLGEVVPGIYKNQAQLFGLPVGLGETRKSDDPRTLAKRDSTSLEVIGVDFDTLYMEEVVCVGNSVVLDGSFYGVTFEWDDGETSGAREVFEAGTYTQAAYSFCDTFYLIYTVEESLIDVSVSASETEILLGEQVQLSSVVTQTGQVSIYNWNDPFDRGSLECLDCPDPIALPIGDATYQLTVTDEFGCTATDEVSLLVDTEKTIYAPNVFSPNGDGVNDIFFLQGKGLGEIYRLDIYNRWGGLVYSAPSGFVNDITIGWNGKIKGRYAEPGVFAWVADVRYLDDTREIIAGDVTLLR